MQKWLCQIQSDLSQAKSLDGGMDIMAEAFSKIGLSSINYDYSPTPITCHGDVVTPALLLTRNAPESMLDLWRNHGYYQIDPVSRLATRLAVPFCWSYFERTPALMLNEANKPVVEYLYDTRLTVGVTVPIRRGDGSLSTFTGIRIDPERGYERDIEPLLSSIGLAAYLFHNYAFPRVTSQISLSPSMHLTPRERECLQLCARGFSAKQIAKQLDRSVATATLHLQSAINKLRARNRTHAVSIALTNRLIDTDKLMT